MKQRHVILIVEDEADLADILKAYLEVEGFEVLIAHDGEEGLKTFQEQRPQLVLLDIMLPKLDGMELCKFMRNESDVPILMISAKSGDMDKVICLGIGADDYVTKPFSPFELVARVKAHLRRYDAKVSAANQSMTTTNLLRVGEIQLDKGAYTTAIAGESINFTTKEFEILCFLVENKNQVFTKEQIYENVWGYQSECGDLSSVTVYIKRIREKLALHNLDYIKTIWGVGYKLSAS